MRIAFLVAPEGVEQVELTEPWQTVLDAGDEPVLVSTAPGEVQAFDHLDKAGRFPVQEVVGETSAEDFGALVLPGGVANPDALRTDPRAVAFVRDLCERGRPVAAICHAAWTLIEADVVRGRTMTSWPSLRTDLTNAGATWVDQEVVRCTDGPGTLITSRRPSDLPAFRAAFREVFDRATV
ncbi:type 1 glutamine amidotransferase domain-containing protein [Streptomyces sp. NPDC058045]|uniref:type 1 glutamine amidotransferase domain-containing protein n=1 Tax=Streptomyces sp. NPDC058045 TaxID=3346311 RepID=UPI0036F0DFF5